MNQAYVAGWKTYVHDHRGNVTNNGRGITFNYDSANQPISMGGNVSASYVYDGNLKRASQNQNGERIYSFYTQGAGLLATFNAQTDTLTEFVRAGGEILVGVESDGGNLLLLIITQPTKIQSMVTFANIIGRIKMLLKNIVVTGLLFVYVSCSAEDNTYLEHMNFEVVIQNENLSLDSYLEFIAEDNYPTVGFGSSVSGWLSMCDIPQLLALVESEKSVKAAYSMVSAQLIMDRSTLAQESVFLLLGLKVDRYPPVMTASMIEEDERDDVIAWAKSEASRNTCGEAEIQK